MNCGSSINCPLHIIKKFFTDRLKIWQRALAKNHVKLKKNQSETLETYKERKRQREREE